MGRYEESMSFPIGETLLDLPFPVFFDPHHCIDNNRPPVSLITGSPGSGKTFFAMLLATHSIISRKNTIILDPKGDFSSLKALEKRKIIGKIKLWSVLNTETNKVDTENQGMLDPLVMSDNIEENVVNTIHIIEMLTFPLKSEVYNVLLPIVQDVANLKESASFEKLIGILRGFQNEDVRALGNSLHASLKLEEGKLLMKPKRKVQKRINFIDGTTVVSLLGLDLPPEDKPVEKYSAQEKVAVSIIWSLTNLIINIMRKSPVVLRKTLLIDEAWVLFGNEYGRSAINALALLGRSRGLATILMTQSPKHISTKNGVTKIDNTISSRFAFRNDSKEDNEITVEAMNLPDDFWVNIIHDLETGQCLMQGSNKKTGIIQIVAPQNFTEAFNTNPKGK